MISIKQLFAGAGVVALTSATAAASVPLSFTHQGILRENGALVNDVRTISAVITDSQFADGTELGRSVQEVKVESGLYTMTISGVDADGVAAAQKLYLHVTVNGEPMEPALEISAVPYALVSHIAESVKTTAANGSGVYVFHRGNLVQEITASDISCPCDIQDAQFDCPSDTFTDTYFDSERCFDKSGDAYYFYEREEVMHPLKTVAIQDDTITIGTTEPLAPLTILSDRGISGGAALHIADFSPAILLEELGSDTNYAIRAKDSRLAVVMEQGDQEKSEVLAVSSAGLEIKGKNIMDIIYPVGSVYISLTINNAQDVARAFGGEWEQLPSGIFLQSESSGGGEFVAACLPNIKGDIYHIQAERGYSSNSPEGVFKSSSNYGGQSDSGDGNDRALSINFNASKSNTIYDDNCSTVQPNAVKAYMYRRLR